MFCKNMIVEFKRGEGGEREGDRERERERERDCIANISQTYCLDGKSRLAIRN